MYMHRRCLGLSKWPIIVIKKMIQVIRMTCSILEICRKPHKFIDILPSISTKDMLFNNMTWIQLRRWTCAECYPKKRKKNEKKKSQFLVLSTSFLMPVFHEFSPFLWFESFDGVVPKSHFSKKSRRKDSVSRVPRRLFISFVRY
jgi:hypothetical protein